MADDVVEELAPSYDPTPIIKKLMTTLYNDLDRLKLLDRYRRGEHDLPFLPNSEDPELKVFMEKSILNLMDHAVETPAEKLYVDSVRPGRSIKSEDDTATLPEWEHWQLSRLDSRQTQIYMSALTFGHAFTVTEKRGGKIQTKSLSPMMTSALYADPANDETPYAAFTVTTWPDDNDGWGEARAWDDVYEYLVLFKNLADLTAESLAVGIVARHGASACPVTRFAAYVDTEGRTLGVVEPLIALQDRINQTNYHTLSIEASGAYKVKTISGMAPPIKHERVIDQDGNYKFEPMYDDNGQPIIDKLRINPAMVLWSEDSDTKFGTMDATPLDGYLQALKDAIRQFTSKSRVPPHFMLGEIANLSADALQALSEALESRVGSFRATFGESWERVFRLAAELNGIKEAVDDYKIEVLWRDTRSLSLVGVADGIQKLATAGFPLKGLLDMIPGITDTQKKEWLAFMEEDAQKLKEENAQVALAKSISQASATAGRPRPAAKPAVKADKVP